MSSSLDASLAMSAKAHVINSHSEHTQSTLEIERRRLLLGEVPDNWRQTYSPSRHCAWLPRYSQKKSQAEPQETQKPLDMLITNEDGASVVQHNDDEPLFCERMLVQTREFASRVDRPGDVRAVYEGGSPTRLDKRWKEYLVLIRARPSGGVRLYLYEYKGEAKMQRRLQRKWTHSLEYKISFDENHAFSIYHPLDFSIAVWNRGSHKSPTVYVFVASSIWSVARFIRTLLIAQGRPIGGPTTVHVGKDLAVRIPNSTPKPVTLATLGEAKTISHPVLSLKKLIWQSVEHLVPFDQRPGRHALTFGFPGLIYWVIDSVLPVVDDYLLRDLGLQLSLLPAPEPSLDEPWPVEGFVVFLATFGLKRDCPRYIYSHEHLLFYCDASKASPPPQLTHESIETRINPFTWSDNISIINEWHRNLELIRRSNGVIDLTMIINIVSEEDTILALEFENTRFRLGFPTMSIRDLWSLRLRDLLDFWKDIRQKRTDDLLSKALNGEFPSTENIPYSSSERSVSFSGFVYMKGHKFSSFRHYLAILTVDAHILFYQRSDARRLRRSKQGIVSSSPFWELADTFELAHGYVFTGLTTSDILMDRDRNFDSQNPGVRSLPRVYADGWRSEDTELDRCFVLISKRKPSMFKTNDHIRVLLARSQLERNAWVRTIRQVMSRKDNLLTVI